MAETPWGWIIGSVVVGAAAGMLLSAGDVRRNPYEGNGRKRRKGRKNPAEYEDFGLDPNASDFERKLQNKKDSIGTGMGVLELSIEGIKRGIQEAIDKQADLRRELKDLDSARLETKRAANSKESQLFKAYIKIAHPGVGLDIERLKIKFPEAWKDTAKEWRDDLSYKSLRAAADAARDLHESKKRALDEAIADQKSLEAALADTPAKIRDFSQQLSDLEEIEYRKQLEEDEEDAAELKRNQQLAVKGLKLLKATDHQKSHTAKRRVRSK